MTIIGALGVICLAAAAVAFALGRFLRAGGVLAVIAGATLPGGLLGGFVGAMVRVVSRWTGELTGALAGRSVPWLLAAVAVAAFVWDMIASPRRFTVVLGFLAPAFVAVIPGTAGSLGEWVIHTIVDVAHRLAQAGGTL